MIAEVQRFGAFRKVNSSVINFIEQGLDQNQNILIHCFMGTSRSCSVATAFVLSQKPELTVQEAVDFVISKDQWHSMEGATSLSRSFR